jgi:hypothetical protein
MEKPRIYAIWTKVEHVMVQATEEKKTAEKPGGKVL